LSTGPCGYQVIDDPREVFSIEKAKASKSSTEDPTTQDRLPRTKVPRLVRDQMRTKKRTVPEVSYELLYEVAEKSYIARMVIWAIVRECTRKTVEGLKTFWDFYPNFALKCTACGAEFQEEIEACYCGSTTFREADSKQLDDIKALFANPNVTYTFSDIVKRCIYDAQVVDDWFISIGYDYTHDIPRQLWYEDPRTMVICADDFGMLGNDEWFCPIHTRMNPEVSYGPDKKTCPEKTVINGKAQPCGAQLVQTSYLQMIDGRVTARFAKDEMVHGTTYATGTRLFGNSPLRSLIIAIATHMAIDNYGYDAFTMQREPNSALIFMGTNQDSVDRTAENFREARMLNPQAQLWLGLQEGQTLNYVKMLDNITNAGTIAEREYYQKVFCSVYGVSPIFVAIETPGRLGNSNDFQIHVQNNTTEANQDQMAEQINRDLLPLFGVTDFHWDFTPCEPDDIKLKADILNAQSIAAKTAVDAGFEVTWDDEGPHVMSAKDTSIVQRERMKSLVIQSLGFAGAEMQIDPALFSGISITGWRQIGGGIGGNNGAPSAPNGPSAASAPSFSDQVASIYSGKMSPRAPESAAGARTLEDDFYANAAGAYEASIDRVISRIGAGMSGAEVKALIDSEMSTLDVKLSRRARTFVEAVYRKGLDQAAKDAHIKIAFDARDEDAVDYLMTRWSGVTTTLPEFTQANRDRFSEIIEGAYRDPGKFNLQDMTKQMREASEAERFKLERIARTETTVISNNGRMNGYLKAPGYADMKYSWSCAPDACERCQEIAGMGPMSVEELRQLTAGFCVHPNDRCTPILEVEGMR